MARNQSVYLLLGSNIEPRIDFMNKAKVQIDREIGALSNESSVYESEPWGFEAEVAFLNQVVMVRTKLAPQLLLEKCKTIEQKLGREKKTGKGYESRVIDIDILYFGNEVVSGKNLQIPHSQIQNRRFTLMPLAEIAANFVHPVLKLSQQQLLKACNDEGKVWKLKKRTI